MATAVIEENLGQNAWGGGVSPMNASYGKLMMWFFLLSDAFTFSGLLVSYGFIRFKHIPNVHPDEVDGAYQYVASVDRWPIPEFVYDAFPFAGHTHLPLVFVGLMTFILILSSVTMVLAVDAGHRMDKKGVEKWMLWTIAGGLLFLGCQAWEWVHFIHGTGLGGANLVENEYGPSSFADFFFFITGFHGTHVLSGVIINIVIFYCTVTGVYQKRGHYEMVEKVGLYWHFVDLVWVFVFTFFYLV
jgi:cytochrome c oxidase subunit III